MRERNRYRRPGRVVWAAWTAAWLWASALGAAAQTAPVAVPEEARSAALDEPVPVSPRVRVGEFANGLRYYIRENTEPENRAFLRLVVNVGSVVEDEDQRGLAHFIEHMAFNGTEHFEKMELVSFMESIGMEFGAGVNAYTGFDETVYSLELPTDMPDYMETAFQILEDWAHALTLDPAEIDQERGVVTEEWRLRRGAGARMSDLQLPVLFRDSRYADRMPIGTLESIQGFDPDSLRRFYREWYRPDLMAVIAVGDFDASSIEALVRSHFASLTEPADPRERIDYPVPDHDETLFLIANDPEVASTSVEVYHKMDLDSDWTIGGYRRRIVERLYNRMLDDRFREIARQPDAPFLYAGSQNGQLIRTKAAYILSAGVPEDGIERGLESLFVEAERVSRFGFTDSELERAKTVLLRGMERLYADRENRSSSALVQEYIRAFLDGESIPGIEYEYELYKRFLPEIGLDDVNQVVARWTRPDNRVVLVSAPRKDGLELPSEADLAEAFERAMRADITPYVDETAAGPLLASVPEGSRVVREETLPRGITEWYLANGIRVVLKPTDFQDDEIVFTGYSPGGTSLASDDEFFAARTATSLIAGGGLGDFDAVALDRALAGKVARASPFIDTYQEGISGSASPTDVETMFQLIYLRFTAPRADEDHFTVWLAQNRQALANRDALPSTAFSDAYTRIITQNHPRSRPITLEMLDQADLYESLAFYRDRFADAGDYTFIFVGNIDFDVMRPLVERYLGALPSTGREEDGRDTGQRPPKGVIEENVYKGIEPQSQTVMAFTGPFDYGDQAARTGIRALGMTLEPRLLDRLREELGAAYTVSVVPQTQFQPVESYTLMIVFASDPERADELVDTVLAEIRELRTTGPTESQVADVRETLHRWWETNYQQNRAWLNQLSVDYQRGVEPGLSVDTFPASVDALTPDEIRRRAEEYFDLDNYVRVTLRPEQ